MSTCHYYHCPQPIACEHYGWCEGHRIGLATWQCEHLLKPTISKQPTQEKYEQSEQPTQEQPIYGVYGVGGVSPLLKADTLPYYLDKIEEYNEPQELIEQLAKSQTEYNSKIEAEMEEMRKKLAKYEENKKLADEIHKLEEKVKSLQPQEKKRTVAVPTITPRPIGQRPVLKPQKK